MVLRLTIRPNPSCEFSKPTAKDFSASPSPNRSGGSAERRDLKK
jgi:hypothetical protein